jgi:hypothetical protein
MKLLNDYQKSILCELIIPYVFYGMIYLGIVMLLMFGLMFVAEHS